MDERKTEWIMDIWFGLVGLYCVFNWIHIMQKQPFYFVLNGKTVKHKCEGLKTGESGPGGNFLIQRFFLDLELGSIISIAWSPWTHGVQTLEYSCLTEALFVTLFYSICLLHKRIVFNLSLTLLLVLSPKLLNFITLLIFLNLSNGSRWMRESNTRFSLSHINLSKLVNLLICALFFDSLHIVVLGLPLLSPLVALLSPLVLK